MSGICIILLLCDYDVKEVKFHTFKLQHKDNIEEEMFEVKKLDGTRIEILFNTMMSFNTMSKGMEFTGLMMYLYFNKCLMDNALEEWHLVNPHKDDQTVKNFKFTIGEWLITLLPDNTFLAQKEWMTNTMRKPYIMKVKDFGNRLKTLSDFLTLMPHDEEKDTVFTDTDLKARLWKSVPITWQNAYLLKGTRSTDNFCQMLAYFVQFQSITDAQGSSKPYAISLSVNTRKPYKYICTNHGQSRCFIPSIQGGRADTDRIPRKNKPMASGPFIDFRGTCPVHPMSSHTWGDCFNIPKNKALDGQHDNTRHNVNHYSRGCYYMSRGRGHGQGLGHHSNNVPLLTNPFPTLYIEQAPANTPLDALSTVTNTNNSATCNNQAYILKHIKKPNRGEKNSRWLYDDVVNCDAVYINDIYCCETATNAINTANLAWPCAQNYSHHFNSLNLQYSQDEILTEHTLDKNNSIYVFDTECIQEVDNFKIFIDIYTNQTECLNTTIQQDLLPISILIPKYIQNIPNHKVLTTALFDSGGTVSLICERVLIPDVKPSIGTNQTITTLAGEFQSNRQVLLQNIVLPEFKRTACIDNHTCQIFIGSCHYDIILGRDFLRKIQFSINFDNNTMSCMDMTLPMQSPNYFSDHLGLRNIVLVDDVEVDSFALMITKSTYQPILISTIIDAQNHLTVEHRNTLSKILNKHTILFDGILKVYPHRLVYLDIIQNATPRHLRAYPVPHIHLDVFKAELEKLCNIGVLEPCGASQ